MKKTKIKKLRKIGIVMLITAVLVSLLAVLVYADEDEHTHTSCVGEHFDWLNNTSGHPENVESCGYVALCELMSFYDAYWDDRFVPTKYEINGIYEESAEAFYYDFNIKRENQDIENIDMDTREGKLAYRDFVENEENIDKYFQPYLISIALEQGYHNLSLSYGLFDYQLIDILETYLYEKCGFTNEQVIVRHMKNDLNNTEEDLFNTAKVLIERGFPVIYSGNQLDFNINEEGWSVEDVFSGHYLIGYKLTKDENDIILSKGWNESNDGLTTTFHTTDFQYNKSIIWIEINEDLLPHTCSESYKYRRNGVDYAFCVCQIYSGHRNHECRIAETGDEPCPDNKTSTNCLCGQVVGGHRYYLRNYNDVLHWYECSCGDADMENAEIHDLYSMHPAGPEYHYYMCNCGYTSDYGVHSLKHSQYTLLDDNFNMREFMHKSYCECGYEFQAPHNFVLTGLGSSTCTDCGYTRTGLGGGGNVILGKKEDEETE